MEKQLLRVAVLLLLAVCTNISAQSGGPEFLSCDTTPLSLCIVDEGVRLPANNKFYLGENHPDATSCSVHVTQKTKVHSTCGKNLQYEVQIFLGDTSQGITLQPLTTITTDSLFEAEISFDTELSPDVFIRQNGIPYTSGCDPYHRIKWIVTDSCGIITTCEKKVDLYDCSSVTYSLPNTFFIVQTTVGGIGIIEIDTIVKDLSDDCTGSTNFIFSLNQFTYQPDSIIQYCDVPAFGVEIHWPIWIADEGRDRDCNGNIEWNERNIVEQEITFVFTDAVGFDCESWPILSGKILTEDISTVANVVITISSQGQIFPSQITGSDGRYSFNPFSVMLPENFVVSAQRNDNFINGVSTLDLVRIQKHLLGIQPLSTPYDSIAADINNSQNISAIDLIELRKLILGIYNEFPNNKSWRFFAKDSMYSDLTHPWPFVEEVNVMNFQSDLTIDFVAVKIGDVNNTVNPDVQNIAVRSNYPIISLKTLERNYKSNELIEIPITINEEMSMQGFQFTISSTDLEFLEAFSDNINISEENYALFDDKITFSWYNENGKQFSKGDIVFTLKARTKSNGSLNQTFNINSEITPAEMYSLGNETYLPVLHFSENNALVLYSAQPNPWKENTSIPFYLDKPGNVTLEISDTNGRIIFSRNENYSEGHHSIAIEAPDLAVRGLLFYSITSRDSHATNKMIFLK
ncbi:MAG TPA: hypothetical protein VMZ69_06920 [Saprospiraceae bacterium]|nr:hypothetical protein [Saprospiraceae bacterium]